MYHALYSSPVGMLRLVSDEKGLRQLWLPNEIEEKICPAEWIEDGDFSINRQIRDCLDAYFAGEKYALITCRSRPLVRRFSSRYGRHYSLSHTAPSATTRSLLMR